MTLESRRTRRLGQDRRGNSLNTDDELVVSATFGDLDAFDELVRRYRYAVMMVASDIMGSHEAAEDVAQDALLTAYKALPQLGDPSKFAGWLYAITRNRAHRIGSRDAARRATPLSAVDEFLLSRSAELGESRFEAAEQRILSAQLVEEMEQIPHEYGTAMQLFYAEEWPIERIAAFLLVPESTVKWRLFQGRKLLQRRLGEKEEPAAAAGCKAAGSQLNSNG